MQIIFSNAESVSFELADNPVTEVYKKIYKNLRHVDVPFRPWNNPYYINDPQHLLDCAKIVGIVVDPARVCSQQYLNQLHQIYELSYNGDPKWSDFHEQIHLQERTDSRYKKLSVDYRELAGPLIGSFDQSWIKHSITNVQAGDIYVKWAELGKTPYGYWADQEPDNLNRLCELSKPWLKLFPHLIVALESQDLLSPLNNVDFVNWWNQRSEHWCKHWKLPTWPIEHMGGVVPLGKLSKIDIVRVVHLLKNNNYPIRVNL